uniref:H15 domain-containing protein n=1 Tax=Pelusios castaneus TaxID=367368 RepID=A0A8C8RFD6_9SAUR
MQWLKIPNTVNAAAEMPSSASRAFSSEEAVALLPKKRGRPSLPDLILRAVCMSAPRKGASLAAIKKALLDVGYNVQKNNGRLKATLCSLVTKGILQRVTGSGVAGSFRLNKNQKGGASKRAEKKTAVKRAKTRIVARRSPKKINFSVARKSKGTGRETRPPKGRKSPARPKGRGAIRGKAAVKRH